MRQMMDQNGAKFSIQKNANLGQKRIIFEAAVKNAGFWY